MADLKELDDLVGEWLTVPDLADRLGVDLRRVRTLLRERAVVGVNRGERSALSIPAAFVVEREPGGRQLLPSLAGTLSVLGDSGFDPEATIRWLFTPDDTEHGTPLGGLLAGHTTEVRRRAQALAF